MIANDPARRQFILKSPDFCQIEFIYNELWPTLGFLPADPENPGITLIAEFMLNELILKNSESLENLNLMRLKELFTDDFENNDEEERPRSSLGAVKQTNRNLDSQPRVSLFALSSTNVGEK